MTAVVHPNYSLPCSQTPGSQTGFHPNPPNPPGWGMLIVGLIILMLVFMIWLFSGLDRDMARPGENIGSSSQIQVWDSKALQRA